MMVENALWKINSILSTFAQQQWSILVFWLSLTMLLLFFVTAGIVVIRGNHPYPGQVSNSAASKGDTATEIETVEKSMQIQNRERRVKHMKEEH